MNRYSVYGPSDAQSLEEGDAAFIGVDSFNTPENLGVGICQAAVNMDFAQGTAATRGGFVCLPELGTSPFGQDWLAYTTGVNNQFRGVAYGNGLFVAVSSAGTVMTSPDGQTWTVRTAASANQWYGVSYAGGLFVATSITGTGDRVMTSPDGITWTSRVSAADNDWRQVAYANGLFVAVATSGTGNRVMTSPNGIDWTSRTSAADNNWQSIVWGNSIFVAVASTGTGDRVMTSMDGITWTSRTSAADNDWNSVAYGGGLFVAVASTGTGNRVMTSPDGITWTARTSASDTGWRSVTYGHGQFVAVSNTTDAGLFDRIMTSRNGTSWTLVTSPTSKDLSAITYGNDRFVIVSSTSATNTSVVLTDLNVFGSGVFSDPNEKALNWIVLVGATEAGFYASGQTSYTVAYPANYVISQQSTVVQANNYIFIFPGEGQTPIQWDGMRSSSFVTVPDSTLGAGFENIPQSNFGLYSQNRLWVVNGKDNIAASDVLDFSNYDAIANDFNLNTGNSDYIVNVYPFGDNGLVVFKNKSSILLQNVQGALTDVTATEITRQLGIIGINAVTAVGPDLIYMSDRNITSISLNLQNQLQASTAPLSREIRSIIGRVNWQAAYKVSMAYWDNKLYVALPLDNATSCNSIVVYNFITKQWWGEWNFASEMLLNIQGFVTANYLGTVRLHCISEDGRIFVTGEGQNDISGTTVAEITASVTTRAYRVDNNSRINRRMYMDLGTNRPDFTVRSYVEGASESSDILTDQIYYRSQSWLFNDSLYDLSNANDDYNRAFRKDYATGCPAETGNITSYWVDEDGNRIVDEFGNYLVFSYAFPGIECGTGFLPEMLQEYRYPIITRRKGRLAWFKVTNTTGKITVNGVGLEARSGDRSSLVQVG